MLAFVIAHKGLFLSTALFICSEWLSLNDKVKSNGVFQLLVSWLKSNAPAQS